MGINKDTQNKSIAITGNFYNYFNTFLIYLLVPKCIIIIAIPIFKAVTLLVHNL